MPQLDLSDALGVRVANQDVLEVKIAGQTVWPVLPTPVAAYNFDTLDGNGDIVDLSGNGLTLFTTASALFATGKEGNALSSLADGTPMAATTSWPISMGYEVTIMGWFKVRTGDGNTGESPLFGFFSSVGGDTMLAVWQSRNAFGPASVLQGNVRVEHQGLRAASDDLYVLPIGVWTHVAFTFNGTLGEAQLYINGTPLISDGYYNPMYYIGQSTLQNQHLFVGGYGYGKHDADTDDVRVFDKALTVDQVRLAMNTPVE